MVRTIFALLLGLGVPALATQPTPGPTSDPATTHASPPAQAVEAGRPGGVPSVPAKPSATTPPEVVAPK